jgi:hypothetical protein
MVREVFSSLLLFFSFFFSVFFFSRSFSFFSLGQLGRLSSNFALSSDLALVLGGRLKFEEMLSGRFADCLGTLYLGYSCLWYYKQLEAQGINMPNLSPCFEF